MLVPEAVRLMIESQGETVRWFQGLPTSTYDPKTNYVGTPGTTVQHGNYYREPKAGTTLKAIIATVRRSINSPEFGWIQVGELTCTTMPDAIPITDGDYLVLTGREQVAKERLTVGADTLSQPYPAAVLQVSDDSRVYVATTDYTVNLTTGVISWTHGGHAPAANAPYAVAYQYHPLYWYVAGDQQVPRPTPLTTTRMPLRGVLTLKPPEG